MDEDHVGCSDLEYSQDSLAEQSRLASSNPLFLRVWKPRVTATVKMAGCFLGCSAIALIIEAAMTAETLVYFYHITRRYDPEDSHLTTVRTSNHTQFIGRSPRVSTACVFEAINMLRYYVTQDLLHKNEEV